MKAGPVRIGVISDTHGLLRPQALEALRGSDHIIHGGDIGKDGTILEQLRAIAPVTAVRGNNDVGDWARALRETEVLAIGGVRICVVHDLKSLAGPGAVRDVAAVVSGHSHKPAVDLRGKVLYLNPGSAGPRRFSLPVSVAQLRVSPEGRVDATIVELRL